MVWKYPRVSRRALVVGPAVLVALSCAHKVGAPQTVKTIRSSYDRLRTNIRKYVEGKQCRERARAKVDQLHDMMVEFNDLAFEWRAMSYEAGPNDERVLLLIADDVNARMREYLLHAARVVYSLREDITANAWAKVFPAQPDNSGKDGKS